MSKPSSDVVIREVSPGVWIFSRPFARFGFLPWGGRTTAIKLSTGDVWVLASTRLTEETRITIDRLGPVKWLISAGAIHDMFIGEYKKSYPFAKVIGVEGLRARKKAEGLAVDGEYGVDPADTVYGFEEEIKTCYFAGYGSKDLAFYHVASKSLIEADLLFNLPATEQYSNSKTSPKLPVIGSLTPYGALHKRLVWGLGKDKAAMRRDLKTVSEWDFQRIIMCHGDVIETDAKKAWESAYSKYLTPA